MHLDIVTISNKFYYPKKIHLLLFETKHFTANFMSKKIKLVILKKNLEIKFLLKKILFIISNIKIKTEKKNQTISSQ